jgi:hypothetical protein
LIFGFSARAVAAIVISVFVLSNSGPAEAAGALAVGKCGAYGHAFDYRDTQSAISAAQRQCKGQCTTVTMKRRHVESLWRTRLCGRSADLVGAEHGDAQLLQVRRQGMRHPHLGVRRAGLSARAVSAA